MIDNLIKKLLLLFGNETHELSRGCQNSFNELFMAISRIKYGIRYHEYNRECPCQPECEIKNLLEDSELKDFLERQKTLDQILELLNNPINKDKTVWEE